MAPCGLLLLLLCAVKASPLPTLHTPSSSEVESEDSRRVLGSSVVTSVSVIMDLGNGTKAYFADAAGRPVDKPTTGSLVGTPGGLLSPDRYEFFTFDEAGELVKRFMTLKQIQSLIAGGDGKPGSINSIERLPAEEDHEGSASAMMGVRDVVASVQNVLKGELEANKNKIPVPIASPPSAPVSSDPSLDSAAASWGVILPAIMGSTNDQSPASTEETPVSTPTKPPTSDPSSKISTTSESPAENNITDKIPVSSSEAPQAIKDDATTVPSSTNPSLEIQSTPSQAELKPQGSKVPEVITETSISASYSSSESHETKPLLKRPPLTKPSFQKNNASSSDLDSETSSEVTTSEQQSTSGDYTSSTGSSQESGESSSTEVSSETDSGQHASGESSHESESASSLSLSSAAAPQQANGTQQDDAPFQEQPDLAEENLAIQTIIQELQSPGGSTIQLPSESMTTKLPSTYQQQPSEQISNIAEDLPHEQLSDDEDLTKDLYNKTANSSEHPATEETQSTTVSHKLKDGASTSTTSDSVTNHSSLEHSNDDTPTTADYKVSSTDFQPSTINDMSTIEINADVDYITPEGKEPTHHDVSSENTDVSSEDPYFSDGSSTTPFEHEYDYPSSESPSSEESYYSSSPESDTKSEETSTSASNLDSDEFLSTPDDDSHSWEHDLDTKETSIKHDSDVKHNSHPPSIGEHSSTPLHDYDYYPSSSEQTCDDSSEDGNNNSHKPCRDHVAPSLAGTNSTGSSQSPEGDNVFHTTHQGEKHPDVTDDISMEEYDPEHIYDPHTTDDPDAPKTTAQPETLDEKKPTDSHSELPSPSVRPPTLWLDLRPPYPDPLPDNTNSSSDTPTSISLLKDTSTEAEMDCCTDKDDLSGIDPTKTPGSVQQETIKPEEDLHDNKDGVDTKLSGDIPSTSILQILDVLEDKGEEPNIEGSPQSDEVTTLKKDNATTPNVENITVPDIKDDAPFVVKPESNVPEKPTLPEEVKNDPVPPEEQKPETGADVLSNVKPPIELEGVTKFSQNGQNLDPDEELHTTELEGDLELSSTEKTTDKINPVDQPVPSISDLTPELADSLSSVLSQVVEQVGVVNEPESSDTKQSTASLPTESSEEQQNEQSESGATLRSPTDTALPEDTKLDLDPTTSISDEESATTPSTSVSGPMHSVISDQNSDKYVEEIEKDIQQEELSNKNDSVVKRQEEKLEGALNKVQEINSNQSTEDNSSSVTSTPSTTTTQKVQLTNSPIVYEDAETFNAYGVLTQGLPQPNNTSSPLVKTVVNSNAGQNTEKLKDYLSDLYAGNDKEGTDIVNDSHGDIETPVIKDNILTAKPISKKDNDYIPAESMLETNKPSVSLIDSTETSVSEVSTLINDMPETNTLGEDKYFTTLEPATLNDATHNIPGIIFKNSQLPTTDNTDVIGTTGDSDENEGTDINELEHTTLADEIEPTTMKIQELIASTINGLPATAPPFTKDEDSGKLDSNLSSETTTTADGIIEGTTILHRKDIADNVQTTKLFDEFFTTEKYISDEKTEPVETEAPVNNRNDVPRETEEALKNGSNDVAQTTPSSLPTTVLNDETMTTDKSETKLETSAEEKPTSNEDSTELIPTTSNPVTAISTEDSTKLDTPVLIKTSPSETLSEVPMKGDTTKLDAPPDVNANASDSLSEVPMEGEPIKLDAPSEIRTNVSDSLSQNPTTADSTTVDSSSTAGDSVVMDTQTGIKSSVAAPVLVDNTKLETSTDGDPTIFSSPAVIKMNSSDPLLNTPVVLDMTNLDTPSKGETANLDTSSGTKTSISDPLFDTPTGVKDGTNDIRPQTPISRPQFDPSHQPVSLPVELDPAPYENLGLEVTTVGLSTDVRKFADLCNELAFRLWSSIAIRSLNTARSVVMSPIGLTSILAMVFLGARGPTSGQMNDILGLDDMVTFNPHLVFRNVTESVVLTRTPGVATAAFVRELYSDRAKGKLLDFYKERAQQFYDGHVEEVNFNMISDVLRRRTNLLVKRQTRGKIPEYLRGTNIMLHSPLAAFSANIFQTDCSQASTEGRNGEMYFTVLPSTRQRRLVPVPAAVWRSGFLAGYEPSLDATAVALGGENSLVSVIFILPGQQGHLALGDNLAQLEKRLIDPPLRSGAWTRLLRCMLPRPGLEVQIPRFSHRSLLNMTGALQRMGLKDLFNAEKADLRGLNGVANDLHLSDIVQVNTFSTCAEDSVSTRHHMEVYPTSPQQGRTGRDRDLDLSNVPFALRPRQARVPDSPRLRFDRPFLYVIRHNPTGFLLHMGRFNPHLLH